MILLETINLDFKNAYKEKDEITLGTLRMLKSAIHNTEIAEGKELNENEIFQIINKEIKQRKEAQSQYQQGGRTELAEKEAKEAAILSKYLPKQIGKDEITNIIKKVISETGASGQQDMGKVMSKVMPEIKGKADGSTVSQIVKDLLSKE